MDNHGVLTVAVSAEVIDSTYRSNVEMVVVAVSSSLLESNQSNQRE